MNWVTECADGAIRCREMDYAYVQQVHPVEPGKLRSPGIDPNKIATFHFGYQEGYQEISITHARTSCSEQDLRIILGRRTHEDPRSFWGTGERA